jgi:hypothetical protein
MATRLLKSQWETKQAMEAVVIVGTLIGSFAGAFLIQKAALEGLFRIMHGERRIRH